MSAEGPTDLNKLRTQSMYEEAEKTELTPEEKITQLSSEIATLEEEIVNNPTTKNLLDDFLELSHESQQAEVERVRNNRWGANAPGYTIADRIEELKHRTEVSPDIRLMRLEVKKLELKQLIENT